MNADRLLTWHLPLANKGGIVHGPFQAEAQRETKAQVETQGQEEAGPSALSIGFPSSLQLSTWSACMGPSLPALTHNPEKRE